MISNNKIKVIITGATGMVGEGVLNECLINSQVESILLINRKPSKLIHPKVKEIIHSDFFNLSSIESHLKGYNACFFCLGVSSIGMKEKDYYNITYTLTLHFASILNKVNSQMTFCYISGLGTDNSEKGKIMWARIKGKTENDLMKLKFRQFYAFRPSYLHPDKKLKNTLEFYKYIGWMYPLARKLFPTYFSSLSELGKAMINSVNSGINKNTIEVKDIIEIAKLA